MPTSSRGPPSSSHGGSPVQVLSVPENLPIVVRFLGPYRGLVVHWKSGRSEPCDGPGECNASLHRLPPIWKGYAPVEQWDGPAKLWRPAALEVTGNLEEVLRDRELRGEVWTLLRRTKKGKTDPVQGVFCERLSDNKLSAFFDVVPVLLRLFNRTSLRLDVPNFTAPKVILEAVAGDAPKLPPEALPNHGEPEDLEARRSLKEMMAELRGTTRPASSSKDQAGEQLDRNGSNHQGKNGR